MRRPSLFVLPTVIAMLLLVDSACQQETETAEAPPVASAIVPDGAELELLFTRQRAVESGLTEGPAAAPDGSIYFSDIAFEGHNGHILRFDPSTGETTAFTEDSGKSNGLYFDSDGTLVAAEGAAEGGRQVTRWDLATGERTVVVDRYEDRRFNSPNDLVLDSERRIYFTDPRYAGDEPLELDEMAVYRIDVDGSVVLVTNEIDKPNGIALSPDGATLYVADTNADNPESLKIFAYPLGTDGLVDGPRRTVVDLETGGCDGMTVDAAGNLYLTWRAPERPGVLIVDPAGEEVGFVSTGAGLPSNVEFGRGEESNVLYVTVDLSLYRVTLNAEGYRPF